MTKNDLSPATWAAQAAHFIDEATGAVVPPVAPATTFARDGSYELSGGYIYGRDRSPNDAHVEAVIARLEGGADARLFASGMAAFVTLFETVGQGQHIIAPDVMYYAGQDWLRRLAEKRGIGLTLYRIDDPAAIRRALRPGRTAVVWVETPVNPTWQVTDIAASASAAHEAGAILAVDSTAATPVTTRPIEFGADIVFHSATKYLNGHADVTAGILVTREQNGRWREICDVRTLMGATPGPFEAWLLLRGMRTLFVRFERASENALRFARALEGHPRVEAVLYPGLASHPAHAIAAKQMVAGFGGMLSILVRGGADEAKSVVRALRVFVPATSLGGVESLVEHRATVESATSSVAPNLLRLSIGIESVDDLVADMRRALDGI